MDYLAEVRGGDLSKVGYVATGLSASLPLGRLLLPEPGHRFGENQMLLLCFSFTIGLQLVLGLCQISSQMPQCQVS